MATMAWKKKQKATRTTTMANLIPTTTCPCSRIVATSCWRIMGPRRLELSETSWCGQGSGGVKRIEHTLQQQRQQQLPTDSTSATATTATASTTTSTYPTATAASTTAVVEGRNIAVMQWEQRAVSIVVAGLAGGSVRLRQGSHRPKRSRMWLFSPQIFCQ